MWPEGPSLLLSPRPVCIWFFLPKHWHFLLISFDGKFTDCRSLFTHQPPNKLELLKFSKRGAAFGQRSGVAKCCILNIFLILCPITHPAGAQPGEVCQCRVTLLRASSASSCLGELEEAELLIWSHEAAHVISSAERWARHRPEVWAVEGKQAGSGGSPGRRGGAVCRDPSVLFLCVPPPPSKIGLMVLMIPALWTL